MHDDFTDILNKQHVRIDIIRICTWWWFLFLFFSLEKLDDKMCLTSNVKLNYSMNFPHSHHQPSSWERDREEEIIYVTSEFQIKHSRCFSRFSLPFFFILFFPSLPSSRKIERGKKKLLPSDYRNTWRQATKGKREKSFK